MAEHDHCGVLDMNPLRGIQRILVSSRRRAGQVAEVFEGNRYRVRVQGGTIDAVATGNAAFLAGDEVAIREGVILGRVKPAASVKVYSV